MGSVRVRRVVQAPLEVLDYGWDWSDWLDGDAIAGSSWAAAGLSIDADSMDADGTTVWLSDPTVGTRVAVTNRITTVGGRTAERTFYLKGVASRVG